MAKKQFGAVLKNAIDLTLKRNANSTTCINIYQPKAPEALKKFSKINDVK